MSTPVKDAADLPMKCKFCKAPMKKKGDAVQQGTVAVEYWQCVRCKCVRKVKSLQ